MARVTVILPTFNHGEFLGEAMTSILTQSWTDFELVVINDGSTDQTEAVLANFSDPRLKIIRHPSNIGFVKSLNEGLKNCSSEFIARLDADDISAPMRLQKQIAFLDKNKEVIMCGSRAKQVNGWRKFNYPTDSEIIRTQLLLNNVISHSSVMWRREIFEKNHLHYDEKFAGVEDYELWARVARVGQIVNLPDYLTSYRIHHNRITVRDSKTQLRNFAQAIKREIVSRWPELNRIDWETLFDFGQIQNPASLIKTEGALKEISLANQKQKYYLEDLLVSVLAEKFLTCASVAAGQKKSRQHGQIIWQIWQKSAWKNLYRGEKKRVWRLWQKCFIK